MTMLRNRRAWRLAAAFLALAASAARAEWQPQWSATWQHPESFHLAAPLRVRVANTGETFAAVGVTHHQVGHVALVKFDAAGNFAWI